MPEERTSNAMEIILFDEMCGLKPASLKIVKNIGKSMGKAIFK